MAVSSRFDLDPGMKGYQWQLAGEPPAIIVLNFGIASLKDRLNPQGFGAISQLRRS
jgi:hypothetical protein